MSETQANNAETRRTLAGNASLFADHVALTLNEHMEGTRERAAQLHTSLNSSEPLRFGGDRVTVEIDREGNRRYYEGTRLMSEAESRSYEESQLRQAMERRLAAVDRTLEELGRRPQAATEQEATRNREAIAQLTHERGLLNTELTRIRTSPGAESVRDGVRVSFRGAV